MLLQANMALRCAPAGNQHVTWGGCHANAPAQRLQQQLAPPRGRRALQQCRSNKNNIGKLQSELLDFVTAGPKMRKWYGQESNQNLPRDGGGAEEEPQQPEDPEDAGERDYVLVTDADTPTGELVVLQLILARAKIRVLVQDTAAAKTGYGPYVQPLSVDLNSAGGLARALKNVATVVVLGRLGALLPAAQKAGVTGLVLLSTAGMPQPGGLAGLFQDAADAALKEPQREAALAGSSLPHVIVKAGLIEDVPGGTSSISISRGAVGGSSSGSSLKCSISREDLASAVVASAGFLVNGKAAAGGSSGAAPSLVVQVQAAGPGQPPQDWEELLEDVMKPAVAR